MTVTGQGNKKTQWLWIGLGGAVLFFCCAVAIAFFTFYKIGESVVMGVTTDREAVSRAAHEIVDYELPNGYKELKLLDMVFYSSVSFGPSSTDLGAPIIMLAQFRSGWNEKQIEEQIRTSFEQQYGRRGLTMELKETINMTIRGVETGAAIYEGTEQSGAPVRELITTFPGKNGKAMLIIMGSPNYWDNDEVDLFIESIH